MSKETYQRALTAIGGLSHPSKMPTASYSIPAIHCKLGSLLRKVENSTCSGCYARKGCYTFRSTVEAMDRRFSVITAILDDEKSAAVFVENFTVVLAEHYKRTVKLIARKGRPGSHDGRFFRWHDSGDLQSISHLSAICEIAERTPEVAHWLPTREAGIVKAFLQSGRKFPSNLRVRLSVPMMDQSAPAGFLQLMCSPQVTFSAVHSNENVPAGAESCIAYTQDGNCQDCRKCWGPEGVSYPLH